jgi:hypothetical protein
VRPNVVPFPRLDDRAGNAQAPVVDIPDRYELKYIVPDWQTQAIRAAIEPFCVRDAHARAEDGYQYPVQSLYLDTPTRALYGMSQQRRARRWKARIRRYQGAQSIFLEIKNKDHDLVRKQRAVIPLTDWQERLAAGPATGASPAERAFAERVSRHDLLPALLVRYEREAWVSTVDSYARVTFDRRIVCQPWQAWSLDGDDSGWIALDDARAMGGIPHGVIVELKCLRAVPRWLSGLTRGLSLPKIRYSKYCKGMDRVHGRGALVAMLSQL